MTLLERSYPALKGIQDPIKGAKISKNDMSNLMPVNTYDESIQIHHVRNNHWVLSTGRNGKVYVYDSIYSKADIKLQKQLCQIYKFFVEDSYLNVYFPKVLRQHGTNDCGYFCIAYKLLLRLDFSHVLAIHLKFNTMWKGGWADQTLFMFL